MPIQPTERCLICGSRYRWAIDNMVLSEGKPAGCRLAGELGFSTSGFYRHAKSHMALSVDAPPVDPVAIEWVRATMSLSAAVESYRIVVNPGGIDDIAILVGRDDLGQFIELALLYSEGAVDRHQVNCMAHDLNLDIEDEVISPGIRPTHRMSAKLRTDEVFVGRRFEKRC